MSEYDCAILQNWQFWLSAVPILISLIAIIQTARQAILSNKLGLFELRLEKYLLFTQLIELYEGNKTLLQPKNKGIETIPSYYAAMLTNCATLENMSNAFDQTLSNPEKHKAFLIQLEELKNSARKTKLLWSTKYGREAGCFIEAYASLLFKLYQQQIAIHGARKQNAETHSIEVSPIIQEAAKDIGLIGALENLNTAHATIIEHKVDKWLIKKIKL